MADLASPASAKSDGAPLNATLSYAHGLRCIAVLEKAIERLQLLSLLNYGQGLEEGPSGVGNILEEQKRLEHRYEELLVLLSKRKPNMMDPQLDCYSYVDNVVERRQKEELHAISAQLKEFAKQLTRQLKENPNDADNWKKVLNERNELTNTLAACVKEMTNSLAAIHTYNSINPQTVVGSNTGAQLLHFDSSGGRVDPAYSQALLAAGKPEVLYEVFAKKIIDEQNEKIWADEIVKREKETNMNVKTLQNEVTQERQLKEREIEERQIRLNELKTKVRKLKQEAKEQSEKRKADSEAQAEARAREAKDRQRHLREQIERLQKMLEIEQEVFAQTEKHMNKKSGQLQSKTSEWTHRQDEENRKLDDKLTNEKRRREDQLERLAGAEERHTTETHMQKARDDAERRQAQEKKLSREMQRSEYEAATKLQCSFKAFLVRKQVNDMKKKKGKKGGGGGKKKK